MATSPISSAVTGQGAPSGLASLDATLAKNMATQEAAEVQASDNETGLMVFQ